MINISYHYTNSTKLPTLIPTLIPLLIPTINPTLNSYIKFLCYTFTTGYGFSTGS